MDELDASEDPLLIDIERFLQATYMQPTVFGKLAINEASLVLRLRRGRECRRATRQRIRTFMKAYADNVANAVQPARR